MTVCICCYSSQCFNRFSYIYNQNILMRFDFSCKIICKKEICNLIFLI